MVANTEGQIIVCCIFWVPVLTWLLVILKSEILIWTEIVLVNKLASLNYCIKHFFPFSNFLINFHIISLCEKCFRFLPILDHWHNSIWKNISVLNLEHNFVGSTCILISLFLGELHCTCSLIFFLLSITE